MQREKQRINKSDSILPILEEICDIDEIEIHKKNSKKFTKEETQILESYARKKPKWGKEDQYKLSKYLDTSVNKIYKWHWEFKRK